MGVRGICYNSENNSVLLVKHTYSTGWELPGGGVGVGEPMLRALKRELSEEVGLKCTSTHLQGIYHNSVISKRDHVVIYVVEEWQEEQNHERPKMEISEAAWHKLDGLPEELTPCTICGLEKFKTKVK